MSRHNAISLFSALRRDRLVGLWLATLLLFIPYLHPLSEAFAAGKPFAGEICSTFGETGKAAVPAMADDCAACVAGVHTQQLLTEPSDIGAVVIVFVGIAANMPRNENQPSDTAVRIWLAPPGQAPPLSV